MTGWGGCADDAVALAPAQAQADLDRFCSRVGDTRTRRHDGARVTVAELTATEPLAEVPRSPYPAAVAVTRTVSAQALVSFRGNTYSVPPGMAGRELIVSAQLGQAHLEVATEAGVVLARHHRGVDGAGAVIRDAGHVTALEHAVLAAFSDRAACRGKVRPWSGYSPPRSTPPRPGGWPRASTSPACPPPTPSPTTTTAPNPASTKP
jgi:hypothetical protein